MLSISEIIQIAFLAVFREQLQETGKSYPEKKWISLLISYAEHIFNKTEANIIFKSTSDEMAVANEDPIPWHTPTAEEFYSLTCDLKEKLRPIDYLLFKAWFTMNDNETAFLLKQAQMMCPENFRMTVISYFMSDSTSDNSGQILQQLSTQAKLSHQQAPKEYIYILNLIPGNAEEQVRIIPAELANFINRSSFSRLFKFSFLHMLRKQIDAALMKLVLELLTIRENENHLVWLMINAITNSELNNHHTAMGWFQEINMNRLYLSSENKLELLYHYSRSLACTGKEQQSASLLKELVFSEDYENCYNDAYYHALIDLARHFVIVDKADDASNVLSILHEDDAEYLADLRGEDYYLLMADKNMLENKLNEALKYYMKAFDLSGNEEIEKKIKLLLKP